MTPLHGIYAVILTIIYWRILYLLHDNYLPQAFPPGSILLSGVLAMLSCVGLLLVLPIERIGTYWIVVTNGDLPSKWVFWISTLAYTIWVMILICNSRVWGRFLNTCSDVDGMGGILLVFLIVAVSVAFLGYCANISLMMTLMRLT